jgi:hypothetical protein
MFARNVPPTNSSDADNAADESRLVIVHTTTIEVGDAGLDHPAKLKQMMPLQGISAKDHGTQ